jgi:hypothetical protein
MRVNVYAEEMTQRVELVRKRMGHEEFTGVRFYLELPATVNGINLSGPFMNKPGDDDSSAVTFWGKQALVVALFKALRVLVATEDPHIAVMVEDYSAILRDELFPLS